MVGSFVFSWCDVGSLIASSPFCQTDWYTASWFLSATPSICAVMYARWNMGHASRGLNEAGRNTICAFGGRLDWILLMTGTKRSQAGQPYENTSMTSTL